METAIPMSLRNRTGLERSPIDAKQMLDGLTNRLRLDLIEPAHDPFEFEDHCQRHKDRRRFDDHSSSEGTLPLGLRIIWIVAVEAREDVCIDGDHFLPRGRLSVAAGSNSESRRGPAPGDRGLVLIMP